MILKCMQATAYRNFHAVQKGDWDALKICFLDAEDNVFVGKLALEIHLVVEILLAVEIYLAVEILLAILQKYAKHLAEAVPENNAKIYLCDFWDTLQKMKKRSLH